MTIRSKRNKYIKILQNITRNGIIGGHDTDSEITSLEMEEALRWILVNDRKSISEVNIKDIIIKLDEWRHSGTESECKEKLGSYLECIDLLRQFN